MLWTGWHKLWKLHVVPRVKHFIWLLLHGKISTTDYLNSINLGPRSLCIFCNIESESVEHLFKECCYAQLVWNSLNHNLGINISFPDYISLCSWITDYKFFIHTISVIAANIWYLWKARCDAIFNCINPNFPSIAIRAIALVKDFMQENTSLLGRHLLLSNFSHVDGLFLFYAHKWNETNKTGNLGFFYFKLYL